ncbi:MAG TPA: radical SAM protein [bacterium]|nr:radical SAM protein [bacterium]
MEKEIYYDKSLKTKIKKILLISPHGKITITEEGSRERKFSIPPLGLTYLASGLIKKGYDVEILDVLVEGYENEVLIDKNTIIYGLSDYEIKNRIKLSNPDMIGVSCIMSNRYKEVLRICKLSKEVEKSIHVVVGGHHPTGMPEMIMDPNIDYILRGEADNTFPQLVDSINVDENLLKIYGIVIKKNGEIFQNTTLDYSDFKSLPMPAWHLIDFQKYWDIGMCDYEVSDHEQKKFLIIITSRGCPHKCYYCTSSLMTGQKYRVREIEDILNEIRCFKEKFDINRVYFWDDNFFINKKRTVFLLNELIQKFSDLRFDVINGSEANALDDEVIELLAKAGFKKVVLDIESPNERIQKSLIDKNVNLSRIPYLVKKIHENGMLAEGVFMVGFPGETREEIDNAFEKIQTYNLDRISITIVNPLPGTGLYQYCVKNNILYEDFDPYNLKWSIENIKLEGVERGYLAKKRREVWLKYMNEKIDVLKYEREKSSIN